MKEKKLPNASLATVGIESEGTKFTTSPTFSSRGHPQNNEPKFLLPTDRDSFQSDRLHGEWIRIAVSELVSFCLLLQFCFPLNFEDTYKERNCFITMGTQTYSISAFSVCANLVRTIPASCTELYNQAFGTKIK